MSDLVEQHLETDFRARRTPASELDDLMQETGVADMAAQMEQEGTTQTNPSEEMHKQYVQTIKKAQKIDAVKQAEAPERSVFTGMSAEEQKKALEGQGAAVKELGIGMARGLQNGINFVIDVADKIENWAAEKGYGKGDLIDEKSQMDFIDRTFPASSDPAARAVRKLGEITVPIAGMKALGMLSKAQGTAKFVKEVAAASAMNAAFLDPDEKRLSDLLNEIPSLRWMSLGYLRSKDGDTKMQSRMKNAAESALLDTAATALFMGTLGAYKAFRNIKQIVTAPVPEITAGAKATEDAAEIAAQEAKVAPKTTGEAATPKPQVNPEMAADAAKNEKLKETFAKIDSNELPELPEKDTQFDPDWMNKQEKVGKVSPEEVVFKQAKEEAVRPVNEGVAERQAKDVKKARETLGSDFFSRAEMRKRLSSVDDPKQALEELQLRKTNVFESRASQFARGGGNQTDEQLFAETKKLFFDDEAMDRLLNRPPGTSYTDAEILALRLEAQNDVKAYTDYLEKIKDIPDKELPLADQFIEQTFRDKMYHSLSIQMSAAHESGNAVRTFGIDLKKVSELTGEDYQYSRMMENIVKSGGETGAQTRQNIRRIYDSTSTRVRKGGTPREPIVDLKKEINPETGKVSYKVKARKIKVGDKVSDAVEHAMQRDSRWSTLNHALYEYWLNNVIGVKSLAKNLVSNTVGLVLKPVEQGIGNTVSRMLRLSGNDSVPAAYDMMVGEWAARAEAFDMSKKVFRGDLDVPKDFLPKFSMNRKSLLTGENLAYVLGTTYEKYPRLLNLTEKVIAPYALKTLSATDAATKVMHYRSYIYANAVADTTRQALKDGIQRGTSEWETLLQYNLGHVPAEVEDAAVKGAQEFTFTSPLVKHVKELNSEGAVVTKEQSNLFAGLFAEKTKQAMSAATARIPFLGRMYAAFTDIGVNMADQALQYTPGMNFLSPQFRDKLFAADPAVRNAAIGKMTLGAAVTAPVMAIAYNGWVTEPDSLDYKEKQAVEGIIPPYSSLRVGDKYYAIPEWHPFGMFLKSTSEFMTVMKYMSENDQRRDQYLKTFVALIADNYSAPFLSESLPEFTKDLDSLSRGDVGAVGSEFLKSLASGVVPSQAVIRDLNNYAFGGNVKRDTKGATPIDSFINKIKSDLGLGKGLPLQRNLFGRPRIVPSGWGYDAADPTYTEYPVPKETQDMVKELQRLSLAGPILPPERTEEDTDFRLDMPPRVVRKQFDNKTMTVELDNYEYERFVQLSSGTGDEFKKLSGGAPSLEDTLIRGMRSSEYQKASDTNKKIWVHDIISAYRSAAAAYMNGQKQISFEELLKRRAILRTSEVPEGDRINPVPINEEETEAADIINTEDPPEEETE